MKKIVLPILAALLCSLDLTNVHAVGAGPVPAASLRGLAEAPLCFEANQGQAGDEAGFIARGRDFTVFVTPTAASLVVDKSGQPQTVRLILQGASPRAEASGLNELPGRANYFLGADASQWRTGVPVFSRVRIAQVYPGVDVVYYADQSARLEYDFLLQPGADPKQISLHISGADQVRLDAAGDLVLKIGGEEVRQHKPVIYQTVGGVRKEVAGGYRLTDKTTAGFWLGTYDHSRPLVIDPTILAFSSYVAGKFGDHGWDIAADANGNVYICGDTLTSLLVSKKTAQFQTLYGGTRGTLQYGDAFVAKFVPNSSNVLSLAYLTYLGGIGQDSARGIAVDSAGNAYVTGFTDSPNFPVAPAQPLFKKINGLNNTPQGLYRSDAFVTKIGPEGTNLVYSTYLGGLERDAGNAIAVDAAGYAYVAGFTESFNFPIVTNQSAGATRVIQKTFGGVQDAFVTKLGLAGTNLEYSTFLGGASQDSAQGIAVDADGNAYLTGYTLSANFPMGAKTTSYLNGLITASTAFDAFFTKLSADGATNIYTTYIGGKNTDVGLHIAVQGEDAYVAGYSYSVNFPVTGRVANTRTWTNSAPDVFVTKFSPTNVITFKNQIVFTNLVYVTNQIFSTNLSYATSYSVKFGGGSADEAYGIAVDAAGEACITGFTTGTNFFGTNVFTDLRSTNKLSNINRKTFIALLNADASAFQFAGLLGGSGTDLGHGVALDPSGRAYVVGGTSSIDFPTQYSIESRPGGKQRSNDVFVVELLLPISN